MLHHPWVIGHRGVTTGLKILIVPQGAVTIMRIMQKLMFSFLVTGVPVVIHDDDLSRLAHEREKVKNLTAKQLRKINGISWQLHDKIPTLDGSV